MSRRFALHHAPAPPRKAFWWGVGLVLLVLAVPLVAFNLAVDPFDFRLTPHLPLARAAIMPQNDTALWMQGAIRRIPKSVRDQVTLVCIGDSRTDALVGWRTDLRLLNVADRDLVLNLSFGGASFDDTLQCLETELPTLPRLRGVIIGMPIERIGVAESDLGPEAIRLGHEPLFYALNLRTLSWGAYLLREQARAAPKEVPADRPSTSSVAEIPRLARKKLEPAANTALAQASPQPPASPLVHDLIASWLRGSFAVIDPALLQKRLSRQLAPLVESLKKKGIEVVFFIPPLREEIWQGGGPSLAEAQARYQAELSRLAPVEDFSRGDRPGIPLRFSDHAHVTAPVAAAIFSVIYLRHFATTAPKPSKPPAPSTPVGAPKSEPPKAPQ